MFLIDCSQKHAFVISVWDILDHDSSFADLINVIQINDKLSWINFTLSFLLIVSWVSTHMAVLQSLSIIHSDVDLLVSHLLVHLARILHLTSITILYRVNIILTLFHSHLLLDLLDLQDLLLHLLRINLLENSLLLKHIIQICTSKEWLVVSVLEVSVWCLVGVSANHGHII